MKKILTVILTVLISFTTLSINVVAEEPQVDSLNEIKEEIPEEEESVISEELDVSEISSEVNIEEANNEDSINGLPNSLESNEDVTLEDKSYSRYYYVPANHDVDQKVFYERGGFYNYSLSVEPDDKQCKHSYDSEGDYFYIEKNASSFTYECTIKHSMIWDKYYYYRIYVTNPIYYEPITSIKDLSDGDEVIIVSGNTNSMPSAKQHYVVFGDYYDVYDTYLDVYTNADGKVLVAEGSFDNERLWDKLDTRYEQYGYEYLVKNVDDGKFNLASKKKDSYYLNTTASTGGDLYLNETNNTKASFNFSSNGNLQIKDTDLVELGNGFDDDNGVWFGTASKSTSTRNKVYLFKKVTAHTHGDWVYSLDDDGKTIVATCGKSGCSEAPYSVSMTLVPPTELEYDKKAKGITLDNSETFVKETGVTPIEVIYDDGVKESSTPPTNAGNYTASVTIGGVTAFVSYEVTKVNVPRPVGKKLEYNGQEQTGVDLIEGITKLDGGEIKAKDAKEYAAGIALVDPKNYRFADPKETEEISSNGEVTAIKVIWNIAPKKLTVKGPKSVEVGEKYEYTVEGIINSDTDYKVLYDGKTTTPPTTVGKHYVDIAVGSTNYVFENDKQEIRIDYSISGKKITKADIEGIKPLVYNGKVQYANLPEGVHVYAGGYLDDIISFLGFDIDNHATDAGKYTALVKLDDGYEWADDAAEYHRNIKLLGVIDLGDFGYIPWVIKPKEIIVTVKNKQEITYGDSITFSYDDHDGFEGLDELGLNFKYYVDGKEYRGQVLDAKEEYQIYVGITNKYLTRNVLHNYGIKVVIGTLKVNRAPLTVTFNNDKRYIDKVYDGEPFVPELVFHGLKYGEKLEEAVMTPSLVIKGDYLSVYYDKNGYDNTKNAGDKEAVVSLVYTDTNVARNYELAGNRIEKRGDNYYDVLNYAINPKHIKVTWEKELVYNGSDQAPEFVVEDGGIVDGDDLTIKTLVLSTEHVDVSKYMIIPFTVGEDTNNYLVDLPSATPWFEITPYELHLIWSPKVKFVRHSYKQAPYITDVEYMQGEDTYGMQGHDESLLEKDVYIMYQEDFGPQLHTGKYIAKVELAGPKAKNYVIKEGDEQIAFKIYRKPNEDTTPVKTGVDR